MSAFSRGIWSTVICYLVFSFATLDPQWLLRSGNDYAGARFAFLVCIAGCFFATCTSNDEDFE